MEVQSIFQTIAIFFALVTLGYFVGNYLDAVPSSVKVFLLFLVAVILFMTGDYLRRRDK